MVIIFKKVYYFFSNTHYQMLDIWPLTPNLSDAIKGTHVDGVVWSGKGINIFTYHSELNTSVLNIT